MDRWREKWKTRAEKVSESERKEKKGGRKRRRRRRQVYDCCDACLEISWIDWKVMVERQWFRIGSLSLSLSPSLGGVRPWGCPLWMPFRTVQCQHGQSRPFRQIDRSRLSLSLSRFYLTHSLAFWLHGSPVVVENVGQTIRAGPPRFHFTLSHYLYLFTQANLLVECFANSISFRAFSRPFCRSVGR